MSDALAAPEVPGSGVKSSGSFGLEDRSYDLDGPLRALGKRFNVLVKAEARGELAALKRLDPDRPDKSAFFRLLTDCVPRRFFGSGSLPIGAPGSEVDMVRRFAAIAAIMALRPDGLRPWGLGRAMADTGVSDSRLSMFLTARGALFRDLARRLARRLARDADALPYLDFGRLLLMDSLPEYADEANSVRVALAREFRRAVRRNEYEAANELSTDDHE
jgi:CRISPR-associated protein Cse2 (CRISPR_cse2)